MPGIVSKSHKADEEKNIDTRMIHRVRISLAREPSNLSNEVNEEAMHNPEMFRLITFLEGMPVEERILEFSAATPEEDHEYQAEKRIRETEEARRARETEEDRKNYLNRFFR
ncbi:PREDICTED: uncharacterized protein LOC107161433 [Diuraphis noxia]|uniref:uncharacterized protein LOC107161433 n=1 Tax=Diuraphis noxia TaxID=143948 RepID=UPI000763B5D0|nr:PREDICTED: uncharacterized protein LOC107161433 [Diuraphis noxia]